MFQPKEELSVHGNNGEADDLPIESDDDLSDDSDKQVHDEVGSVDEESTKSDEEYDDLAMQDMHEAGYWSDDDEPKHQELVDTPRDKYSKNLDLTVRCRRDHMKPSLCSYSSVVVERNAAAPLGNIKIRRRLPSIPAFGKNERNAINGS